MVMRTLPLLLALGTALAAAYLAWASDNLTAAALQSFPGLPFAFRISAALLFLSAVLFVDAARASRRS